MNEVLSLYDVSSTLANIDANVGRLLFFGALALLCNFVFFGSGIYLGFKHKVVSMPISATLIFIPHDLVYLLMFDKWFNVYDHWFNQLYWVGLVITNIEEFFFLYLTLKYGRKEYMPMLSQNSWRALIGLGLVGTFVAFVSLKQVLADELWLFTFGLTLWFCVPLVIPMMLRRNSAAGQSRLMWCAFIGMAISYWCAVYPLAPFFQSVAWLSLGAVSIVWAIAVLWFMRYVEARQTATEPAASVA